MKQIFTILATLLLALSVNAQQKQNLKVLYVGGSADWETKTEEQIAQRCAAFESYLKTYFTEVKTVMATQYSSTMSAGYDVTVFDSNLPYVRPRTTGKDKKGETKYYGGISTVTEDFAYPAILIANAAEAIGRGIGTKTDWYCLCLDAHAHHTNLNHAIFKGPFEVNIVQQERPTPPDAFHYHYFYDGIMPKTLPMWQVQTKGYETDKGFRIGMVARPWGFTDSPDAESISSGVCAKTLDAVAIGRHGNFFFWGFSASPEYMTPQAKQVFANAVVYTASLKGQKIIARKYYDRAATREYVKELTYLASEAGYQESKKSGEAWYNQMFSLKTAAQAKKEKGEPLTKEDESYLNMQLQKDETDYNEYLKKRMRNGYYEMFKGDPKAFHKYMKENTPYLYGAAMFYQYLVDEDVKSLKVANNDVALLDKAITLLEKGKEMEKAQRILDRYTLCTFTKPEQWRKWFNENKSRIFFTESGGWVFMVNTLDPSVEGNDYRKKANYLAARELEVPVTDNNNPVSAAATLVTYHNGLQAVLVKMKIQPGYHIYGIVSEKDPYIATRVQIEGMPERYALSGDPICPTGKYFSDSGTTQYEEEAVFIIPITGTGKGSIRIKCEWQCCDSQVCLPPTGKVLEVTTTLE